MTEIPRRRGNPFGIKGALLYGVNPYRALCEAERAGHLNVRPVFRRYAPSKGLSPLRGLRRYPRAPAGRVHPLARLCPSRWF